MKNPYKRQRHKRNLRRKRRRWRRHRNQWKHLSKDELKRYLFAHMYGGRRFGKTNIAKQMAALVQLGASTAEVQAAMVKLGEALRIAAKSVPRLMIHHTTTGEGVVFKKQSDPAEVETVAGHVEAYRAWNFTDAAPSRIRLARRPRLTEPTAVGMIDGDEVTVPNVEMEDVVIIELRGPVLAPIAVAGTNPWMPNETGEFVATCQARGAYTRHRGGERAPHPDCECGLWALNDPGQLTGGAHNVIGKVAAYGLVIEGTLGIRAEKMKILELYVYRLREPSPQPGPYDWDRPYSGHLHEQHRQEYRVHEAMVRDIASRYKVPVKEMYI